MDNRPIGFFDSGIGGLSCVDAMLKAFPNESLIYYGDTARAPYGSKSISTITNHSLQIADYLVSRDVKMLVIACNTITAVCVERLRTTFPQMPIVGIIEPCVDYLSRNKDKLRSNLGLIATEATVSSKRYDRLLKEYEIDVPFFSTPCPMFVPTVECGFYDGPIAEAVVRNYLDDFIRTNDIKSLILGCTHYPFLKDCICRLYPELDIINPSEIIVKQIANVLRWNDLYADPAHGCVRELYASDLSKNMLSLVQRIMRNNEYRIDMKAFDN